MRRALAVAALVVIAAIGACRAFLPERFAVNAPLVGTLLGAAPPAKSELERRLRVPDGFAVALFADGISNARFLRFTSAGDLLVSSPREGTVFLLERDANGEGGADGVGKLLTGLDKPHGLEFSGDWLYVAETGAVKRVRFDAAARETRGEVEPVVKGLPIDGNHWTKTIGLGPDGWMYLSIGSSCNACIEEDTRRAALYRFKQGNADLELVATGLRNSVGFDWRPADGALYATDNGPDLLGDDVPPCELNKIEPGKFYGWPFVLGNGDLDPDFGAKGGDLVAKAVAPAHPFGAHVAPLGIRFYRG